MMTHLLTDQMTGSGQPSVVSLSFVDFWPACLHAEQGFVNVDFERFDVLLPKANCWLRQHPSAEVIQCQTLERKVNSSDLTDLSADLCDPKSRGLNGGKKFYYVKGLRLWYSVPDHRLDSSLSRRGHASQIGYRNYLPRWREEDSQGRNIFEDLTSTYETVNEDLLDNPVEGKIISVETVALKLSADKDWRAVDVHAEQSIWPHESMHHILNVTRIFYLFECPAYEQIGAEDFVPDFTAFNEESLKESDQRRDATFASAIVKVNKWLDKVKDVRITNIQTIETVLPTHGKHGELKTGSTYIHRADTESLVRFIRVTYVRPKFGLPPAGIYTPKVVTYRTFVPAPLGSPTSLTPQQKLQLERDAWKRLEEWMEKTNDANLVSVEVFLHSLHVIVKNSDEDAETMVSTVGPHPSTPSSPIAPSSPIDPSPDSASTLPSTSAAAVVQCIRIYYETRPTSSITSDENKDVEFERKSSNCALC